MINLKVEFGLEDEVVVDAVDVVVFDVPPFVTFEDVLLCDVSSGDVDVRSVVDDASKISCGIIPRSSCNVSNVIIIIFGH